MKSTFPLRVVATVAITLMVGASIGLAQVPRLFSYQGLMLDKNQQSVTGDHIIEVKYYDATSAGTMMLDETQQVHFHNGIFDLNLGFSSGFPTNYLFSSGVWIEITLDPGSSNEWVFPRLIILSAPYALNTERVNGIEVMNHPVNGALWPVPIGGNGRIAASILPAPDAPPVISLNTVSPDASGAISLLAGNGIALTPNASTHTIKIAGSKPPVIDTLVATFSYLTGVGGNDIGLFVGTGYLTNSLFATGTITDNNFALGSITSSRFAPNTSATMVAVGTTAQHPAIPVQGTIRFNTDTGKFEGYDGTAWSNLN